VGSEGAGRERPTTTTTLALGWHKLPHVTQKLFVTCGDLELSGIFLMFVFRDANYL